MSAEGRAGDNQSAAQPATGALSEFLHRLDEQMKQTPRLTPLPDTTTADLREIAAGEDLTERFVAEATAAGCSVTRVGEDGWQGAVLDIVQRHKAATVMLESQPGTAFTEGREDTLRQALEAAAVGVSSACDDETLFNVDAAVTGVLAAVAETGTLVCVSGKSSARGVSLIPPVHIALLSVSQIVGDLFDYFDQLSAQADLPANVNLISGPSKTADIEGILITGVHGPGHVHIVVLE